MEWILVAGIAILIGFYVPILAAQFVVPEKIRICAIIGARLVVIGTALQIVAVGQLRTLMRSRRRPIKNEGLAPWLNRGRLKSLAPAES
jgi:hypothetical protein